MGKTLEECYEVLGLDYSATEGIFFEKLGRFLDVFGLHVHNNFDFHTFSRVGRLSFASLSVKLSRF